MSRHLPDKNKLKCRDLAKRLIFAAKAKFWPLRTTPHQIQSSICRWVADRSHALTCTCSCSCTYACAPAHAPAHAHMHICTLMHTCTCTCSGTYARAHMHMLMHMHICSCTYSCTWHAPAHAHAHAQSIFMRTIDLHHAHACTSTYRSPSAASLCSRHERRVALTFPLLTTPRPNSRKALPNALECGLWIRLFFSTF